jgi:16S rRNA (cytosine1402-N4)-methyltransferase
LDEHRPVLVDEVLAALAVQPAGFYVDATFGRGGHAAALLAALDERGSVLAIDRDPAAIEAGRVQFAAQSRLTLVHGRFGDLAEIVRAHGARAANGILFDCGVSSPQLDQAERGFSFQQDGPLDMRMDPGAGVPVSAWLAGAAVDEIRDVIARLGEERFARRIAAAIDRARVAAPLLRTLQLADIVSGAVPTREPGKHAATRTFQALRLWINDELGQLARGLEQAVTLLAPGGRLAVISFHSLEDRLVRDFLRSQSSVAPALARLPELPASARPRLRLIGQKQRASATEVQDNRRARSALLRVAERTAVPAP